METAEAAAATTATAAAAAVAVAARARLRLRPAPPEAAAHGKVHRRRRGERAGADAGPVGDDGGGRLPVAGGQLGEAGAAEDADEQVVGEVEERQGGGAERLGAAGGARRPASASALALGAAVGTRDRAMNRAPSPPDTISNRA